ncbi:hypothetical protein BKM16_27280 [Pseudomonas amygdali pv. morsprunorum]|nr:hypothetical protein BKM16_27280 [Pseudomonas amygdali pv. morsprunorum]PPS38782.1 hypothetical protein BVY12_06270 [Pseudomonas amygdali pv. morsprunorum]
MLHKPKTAMHAKRADFSDIKLFFFMITISFMGETLHKWLTLRFRFLSNPSERDVIWSIAARPRREL